MSEDEVKELMLKANVSLFNNQFDTLMVLGFFYSESFKIEIWDDHIVVKWFDPLPLEEK